MQALKVQRAGKGWGAGSLLRQYEDSLRERAQATSGRDREASLLRLLELEVAPEWVDYNGHMTEHRYLQMFGDTTDALLARIGVDEAYLAGGHSYFTVETHIMHLGEARGGDRIETSTQLLATDEKRIHLFHRLCRASSGDVLATAEQLLLHVDTRSHRACPAAPAVLGKLSDITDQQRGLSWPTDAGRQVGQPRR